MGLTELTDRYAGDPFTRDQWGRPLIQNPRTGKVETYTRISTIADAVSSDYALTQWRMQCLAIGLARLEADGRAYGMPSPLQALLELPWDASPGADAALAAREKAALKSEGLRATQKALDFKNGLRPDERKVLREIMDQAIELAKGGQKAAFGTAVHQASAAEIPTFEGLDEHFHELAMEDALEIRRFLSLFETRAIEQSVGNPDLLIAGTTDGVIKWDGKWRVFDIKTGRFMPKKQQIQMTGYATSRLWSAEHGWGEPLGVEMDYGLILHKPAVQGPLMIRPITLNYPRLVRSIQEHRASASEISLPEIDGSEVRMARLTEELSNVTSRERAVALWRDHRDVWTDEMTRLMEQRLDRLERSALTS